jgi:hypothetical protein
MLVAALRGAPAIQTNPFRRKSRNRILAAEMKEYDA